MIVRDPYCLTPSTAMIGVADEIAAKAGAWTPIAPQGREAVR
jgi:hypothetical protein